MWVILLSCTALRRIRLIIYSCHAPWCRCIHQEAVARNLQVIYLCANYSFQLEQYLRKELEFPKKPGIKIF